MLKLNSDIQLELQVEKKLNAELTAEIDRIKKSSSDKDDLQDEISSLKVNLKVNETQVNILKERLNLGST